MKIAEINNRHSLTFSHVDEKVGIFINLIILEARNCSTLFQGRKSNENIIWLGR